jgi:hypothetical protein
VRTQRAAQRADSHRHVPHIATQLLPVQQKRGRGQLINPHKPPITLYWVEVVMIDDRTTPCNKNNE